jgi:hypothetical protein
MKISVIPLPTPDGHYPDLAKFADARVAFVARCARCDCRLFKTCDGVWKAASSADEVCKRKGWQPRFWLRVAALVLGLALCGGSAKADERPAIVTAILIYNGFPDSAYKVTVENASVRTPNGVIALPASVLQVPLSRAEAGALVAAVGAYASPDVRFRPRTRLDRTVRFERLLRSLDACPAALASVTAKFGEFEPEGSLAGLLRYVRSERPEYAVAPRNECDAPD